VTDVEIIDETQTYADVDQAFSAREVPWMKMGKLTATAVTAAEAAKLGGLDFTVDLVDVAVNVASDAPNVDPHWRHVPTRRAIIRSDTKDFFGFASSKMYRSLQYAEAFEFMDTINPAYVAAGTLRGGRQGFMVVKPEIQFTDSLLGAEDPHDLYAVLRTSHDCSRGIEVSVMPLRQRCMNQLTLRGFVKGVDYRWSIKHTTTMSAKLAEAQQSLEKIGIYVKRYREICNRLADTEVKPDRAEKLLKMVIPMPRSGKTERTEAQWRERIEKITDLWCSAPQVGFAGTGWGLVNAVSEYFEWHRAGGTAESRFLNALEGETHKKINRMTGMILSNA
jgi:phage/plasmid-like protein (TIGR03299 family)